MKPSSPAASLIETKQPRQLLFKWLLAVQCLPEVQLRFQGIYCTGVIVHEACCFSGVPSALIWLAHLWLHSVVVSTTRLQQRLTTSGVMHRSSRIILQATEGLLASPLHSPVKSRMPLSAIAALVEIQHSMQSQTLENCSSEELSRCKTQRASLSLHPISAATRQQVLVL